MCTLIVAWQVFDTAPVCVAANRDEARDRPSSPPAVQEREGEPRVLAPRDERAGGTWLGYNEAGVLVAVTNRWVDGDGERSRGLLVDDALGARTAREAVDRVEAELVAREYAPFHLVAVDRADCLLVERGPDVTIDGDAAADEDAGQRGRRGPDDSDGGYAVRPLEPGVHVVVNVGFDGDWFVPPGRPDDGLAQAANAERVREVLQPLEGETAADWTGRAGEVLGDHEYGVCVHRNGFGTCSSSLIRLGDDRAFYFADGPPCETAYRRVTETI